MPISAKGTMSISPQAKIKQTTNSGKANAINRPATSFVTLQVSRNTNPRALNKSQRKITTAIISNIVTNSFKTTWALFPLAEKQRPLVLSNSLAALRIHCDGMEYVFIQL